MSLLYGLQQTAREFGPEGHFLGQRLQIPAPVMGWNARDPLSDMKPRYAVELVNYFPEWGRVRLRRGFRDYISGVGSGAVETLISLINGQVTKLYAVGGGILRDITQTGATVDLQTGLTNNRWQHEVFSGRVIMVNGEDDPLRIERDGTLASAHGWTFPAGDSTQASSLNQVLAFKNRLFFLEKDSTNLWYGPISGIQGELTKFPLGEVAPSGGTAVGMGNITLDSGEGVDDMFVVFFSTGVALVYVGTDISDAADWGLRGTFYLGKLVGNRGLVNFGGDVVAITTDGYMPINQLLQSSLGRDAKRLALSDAIQSAVSESVRTFKSNFGWQAVLYTDANWLLFNVPAAGGTVQHVQNTQTGAWCQFTGMPAVCWAVHGDRLFFGHESGGKVCEANIGTNDAGSTISGDVQSAYNMLKSQYDKRFTRVRSFVEADSPISFNLSASVDFEPSTDGGITSSVAVEGSDWAVDGADTGGAAWNVAAWSAGTSPSRKWQTINLDGTAISVRLQTETNGARVSLFASDIMYDVKQGILV